MFLQLGKQRSVCKTKDLFESLNKSEMWAAIEMSGTRLFRASQSAKAKAFSLIISCFFFSQRFVFRHASSCPSVVSKIVCQSAVGPSTWSKNCQQRIHSKGMRCVWGCSFLQLERQLCCNYICVSNFLKIFREVLLTYCWVDNDLIFI